MLAIVHARLHTRLRVRTISLDEAGWLGADPDRGLVINLQPFYRPAGVIDSFCGVCLFSFGIETPRIVSDWSVRLMASNGTVRITSMTSYLRERSFFRSIISRAHYLARSLLRIRIGGGGNMLSRWARCDSADRRDLEKKGNEKNWERERERMRKREWERIWHR